jgi:CelD/BcsL family acetyltransferase involved in cellulose biosynthesis
VTLSTPLVDPDRPAETLDAMLTALKASGVHALALPYLADGQPVATALRDACRINGRAIHLRGGHRRALLRSPMAGAEYVRATLETRRRKEADRQRRRLADTGALGFAMARTPDEVAAALDAFLALESAGWKGQAGTDLRSAPGALSFIRDAAAGLAPAGAFRVATLTLDGRPIASGLIAVAQRRAFYLKTTYDEGLSRFSPGLLLTLDLTAALLDDPSVDDADSIAIADHPMIDRVWTQRFEVASVIVSTGQPRTMFRLAVAAEGWRDAVRVRSKPIRDKLSRRGGQDGKVNNNNPGQADAVSIV